MLVPSVGKLKRDDISEVRKVLFGSASLLEHQFQVQAKQFATKQGLANQLIHRAEFRSRKNRERLRALPVSEHVISEAYYLFLDRRPKLDEIQRVMKRGVSHWDFLRSILRSREYKRKSSLSNLMKSGSFNSIPRTIFLHVPKTAGKSFEQLAIRNYGRTAVSLSTSGKLSASEWNKSAMVGGHFFYSKFNGMTGRRIFLAVVRDPVQRALSRFNYYVNARHQQEFRRRRGFDNNDPAKTMLESGYRQEFINDYQCRYLSGEPSLGRVMEVCSKEVFVLGTLEQIQDWISVVGDRLGWEHRELDRVNVASELDYMEDFLSDKALIRELRANNKEDYALYKFVKKHGVYESAGPDFDYSDFRVTSQLAALTDVEPLATVGLTQRIVSVLSARLQAFRRH